MISDLRPGEFGADNQSVQLLGCSCADNQYVGTMSVQQIACQVGSMVVEWILQLISITVTEVISVVGPAPETPGSQGWINSSSWLMLVIALLGIYLCWEIRCTCAHPTGDEWSGSSWT